MARKKFQPLPYKQKERYSNGMFDRLSETPFARRIGPSALSTFWGARYLHGFSLRDSLKVAKLQLDKLGSEYAGGLECTPFRSKERIQLRLDENKDLEVSMKDLNFTVQKKTRYATRIN